MASRTDQNVGQEPEWGNHLQQAAFSDIGMRRLNNQDSYWVARAPDRQTWEERGHFFMVADGMGAHAAGELASKLAVDGVCHLYFKYKELSPPDALHRALVETNSEIHRRGQANADFRNMGTTASALLLLPQGALVAHIGDSRVYRVRDGQVQQLTRDHSLVWELREQLAENSELSIPKNVITRSLGPNSTVQVDIEGPLPLMAGDAFLLCSDGLTGRITDEELGGVLRQLPPEDAVHLLIDLANLRGGPDNITVIVAKIGDEPVATDTPQPLTTGRRPGPATVQPAVWICFGVCLLGALVLSIIGSVLAAFLSACGATVALLIAHLSRNRHKASGVALGENRRLGKGPYTETTCMPLDDLIATLRDTSQELRNAGGQNSGLAWTDFDVEIATARGLEREGRTAEALKHYAAALRTLMRQVREQQNKQASDSSLDI